jgi:hypothetical protein
MGIRIVSFEPQFVPEVRKFNDRLRSANAFPFPASEADPAGPPPLATECGINFHHFLAIDDQGAVRGSYFIRTQPFLIRKQVHTVGHFTAPLSEGIIDKRYAAVGALLISHALKFQPLLFAMGMGGLQNQLPRIVKAMGWVVYEVPFFFRVLNGSRFFRNLGPLHTSPLRSFFANTLSATGIGNVVLQGIHRLRTHSSPYSRFETERVGAFESWADEAWRQTNETYSFSAVRDSRYLQFLYPSMSTSYGGFRLHGPGGASGWVEFLHCDPMNASYFGKMRVLALVDGVAPQAAIPSLILSVIEEAKRERADLIFSNQMHSDWTGALRNCGFLQGPSNYLLAFSKGLIKLLDPLTESVGGIHFNRGDGDGCVNLVSQSSL